MNTTTRRDTLRTAFRALSDEHFANLHAWCKDGKPIGAGGERDKHDQSIWSFYFIYGGVP